MAKKKTKAPTRTFKKTAHPKKVVPPLRFRRYEMIPVTEDEGDDDEFQEEWEDRWEEDFPELDDMDELEEFLDEFEESDSDKYKEP